MAEFVFLENELWYGGVVYHADRYPISAKDEYSFDMNTNHSANQVNPIFLSNKGRFLWLDGKGTISFNKGIINTENDDVIMEQCGDTLRHAALAAANKYYPALGQKIDLRAMKNPQYCSWVVLLWEQNQEGVLSYARSIIEKGYSPGIIIIDDTWQRDYGVWDFDKNKFPEPKKMIDELHEMGFLVSLWLCPYVSPDAPYRSPGIFEHMDNNRVIMTGDRPRIVHWWEGYSAALDFTKPNAKKWINEQVHRLEYDYGIDGFKLDGGDSGYYGLDYDKGNLQSSLWIESIENPLKECRTCYKLAGKPIIQRLNDKAHRWKNGENIGLQGVIPGMLTQGLVGYYYGCPDMTGGGMSSDFIDKSNLDAELIIRWCQVSCLMPMVQFSYDIWNHKKGDMDIYCKKAMDLRNEFLPYIMQLAVEASKTNKPIIRYMEYEFPNEGFDGEKTQFMLGDKYLVAPILEKGERQRIVKFPYGKWKDLQDGKIYDKGTHTIQVPIDKLPVFTRV